MPHAIRYQPRAFLAELAPAVSRGHFKAPTTVPASASGLTCREHQGFPFYTEPAGQPGEQPIRIKEGRGEAAMPSLPDRPSRPPVALASPRPAPPRPAPPRPAPPRPAPPRPALLATSRAGPGSASEITRHLSTRILGPFCTLPRAVMRGEECGTRPSVRRSMLSRVYQPFFDIPK